MNLASGHTSCNFAKRSFMRDGSHHDSFRALSAALLVERPGVDVAFLNPQVHAFRRRLRRDDRGHAGQEARAGPKPLVPVPHVQGVDE